MSSIRAAESVACLFPGRPQAARRFRGLGRYYRRVRREVAAFVPDLSAGDWYDLWHYHADWAGYGDAGWRPRRSYLDALITVFAAFAREAPRTLSRISFGSS